MSATSAGAADETRRSHPQQSAGPLGRGRVSGAKPVLVPRAGRAAEPVPAARLRRSGGIRAGGSAPRGVGEHPHRGFETVTIVYQGEVEHRDSAGNGGKIGPGDVQWMTAAAGLMHEEFHSQAFTRTGGTMEMVQLWVNLPAKDKMSRPHYQPIVAADIPDVELPRWRRTRPRDRRRVRRAARAGDDVHRHQRVGRAAPRRPVARRCSCPRDTRPRSRCCAAR